MTVGITQLTASRFTLTFADSSYKGFTSDIVEFNHPGVSINPARVAGKTRNIPEPGDKIEFEPLVVRALLDSELSNYTTLYDWLRNTLVDNTSRGLDLILTVYNLNNQPSKQFLYKSAIPTNVGPINFTTTDTNDTTLGFDVTFEYVEFDVVTP